MFIWYWYWLLYIIVLILVIKIWLFFIASMHFINNIYAASKNPKSGISRISQDFWPKSEVTWSYEIISGFGRRIRKSLSNIRNNVWQGLFWHVARDFNGPQETAEDSAFIVQNWGLSGVILTYDGILLSIKILFHILSETLIYFISVSIFF